MFLITLRCRLTGESDQEIMCAACRDRMGPLDPRDVQKADDDLRCTQCGATTTTGAVEDAGA